MILTVVLICISLTISDNEHLFIYLSEKLWKNVYLSLLPFFLIAFFLMLSLWNIYTFWILTPHQTYHLQISFFHSTDCLFILLMLPSLCKAFKFIRSHLFIFFNFIYPWLCWVFVAVWAFSLVAVSGATL